MSEPTAAADTAETADRAAAAAPPRGRGMRTFFTLWLGQTVSLLGSGMTGFALGVWVYQRTGSVTLFSLILFFTSLPAVLLAPIGGALVDRWDRRQTLIWSNAGSGACSLALALLFASRGLAVWHIYLLLTVSAVFQSVRWPAMSASVPLLVPKQALGRANGLLQLGMALSSIGAPLAAGALLGVIGVSGILIADVATFGVAIAALIASRLPSPERKAGGAGQETVLAQAAYGWRYLQERKGLLSLLLLFAAVNFSTGLVTALLTPLVLTFTTAPVLGTVLSVSGVGMMAGGLAMTAWGGPRQKIVGVVAPMVLQGTVLLFAGLRPSALLIGAAAFLFLFAMPIINASSQGIWQSKVAPEVQGRVFAMRQMIALSSFPLSRLVAGPLSDYVFEPLLAPGGALAGSVGRLIGVGKGRGMALLLIVLGALNLLIVAFAWSYPRLRRVEEELPDVLDLPEGGAQAPAAGARAAAFPGGMA